MAKKNLKLYTLPEEWSYPLVASWRVFEKTLNPAFFFILRCGNCEEMNSDFVYSVKSNEVAIGIQCQTEGCGQTLKFDGKIDANADDFPERLRAPRPSSVLTGPDGKKPKTKKAQLKDIITILFGGD